MNSSARCRAAGILAAAACLALLVPINASAQTPASDTQPASEELWLPGEGLEPPHGHPLPDDERRPFARPRRVAELVRALFEPGPLDRGPVQPGEAEKLLEFARTHVPRLAEALTTVRSAAPDVFQRRLNMLAPRLRQLQRLFEKSPSLGEKVRNHAEEMFEIRRLSQMLRNERENRAPLLQELREHVVTAVTLEYEAVLALAAELENRRADRIDAFVEYLIHAPPEDLPRMPGPTRELVRNFRGAATDAERESLRAQLRTRVERFVTMEIRQLRTRAERRFASRERDIDRRVEMAIRGRPFFPLGGPGPRPGRGDDGPPDELPEGPPPDRPPPPEEDVP